MAVLNIRVDDRVRDLLREKADEAGVTLSEFTRELLMAAVVPVYERDVDHGEEPAPESLRVIDRQMLSLLHRILARVLPEDANDVDGDPDYQLMRAKILEDGFTGEYWYETAGFRTELSRHDCSRVSDILQMFRIITYSLAHLAEKKVVVPEELVSWLEFRGFDHNDALESHMASYVEFLMSEDRWTELQPQVKRHDNGNSHYPTLDTYSRMLAEYRRIMDSRERGFSRSDYVLTLEELERVAEARTHPTRRADGRGH